MTAIEELGDYLEQNSYGTIAENIWLNKLPDTPNNIISIFQAGGTPQSLKIKTYYPAFQFRVRDTSHSEALRIINEIYNLMDNNCTRRIKTKSGRVIIIQKLQSPYFLSIDDRDRTNYVLTINVLTEVD